MCLAQGPQRSDVDEVRTLGIESSTIQLRSLSDARDRAWGSGVPRGSKNYFFQHSRVAYQMTGIMSRTEYK